MGNSRTTSREPPVNGAAAALRMGQDGPGAWWLLGELDVAGVPEVQARLVGVDGDVDLDCSGLTFIDASGLRLFVAVDNACQDRGAKLAIVNPSRCVIRLLVLTGLDAGLGVRCENSAR